MTTLLPALDVSLAGHARGLDLAAARTAANDWQAAGSAWVHLVDLDAAHGRWADDDVFAGSIGALIDDVQLAVELAGGIHHTPGLERALATGCERVVIAAAALHDLSWCERAIAAHGTRIAVGLDVGTGRRPGAYEIVPRGASRRRLPLDLWAIVDRLDRAGCSSYVVTDVATDGALAGPNLELLRSIGRRTDTPIVASGGVASLGDLAALHVLPHVDGVIVGAALHAGRFDIAQALDALDG